MISLINMIFDFMIYLKFLLRCPFLFQIPNANE